MYEVVLAERRIGKTRGKSGRQKRVQIASRQVTGILQVD